jgi:hypothetical protein
MRLSGKPLAAVDFGFDWAGDPSGGAPRFSLPIDEDGDGKTEAYAFLDWASCGNAATGGTVSTQLATCAVDYGATRYANWDAFAATNPTYTVAKATPFIISDWTSNVVVSNVFFGSA